MGFGMPSSLSLARAPSPLVTWELLHWISVSLTGYKQGTALDFHTHGSSARSGTHTQTRTPTRTHRQCCGPLCFPSLKPYTLLPKQRKNTLTTIEQPDNCPLLPSFRSLFPPNPTCLFFHLFLIFDRPILLPPTRFLPSLLSLSKYTLNIILFKQSSPFSIYSFLSKIFFFLPTALNVAWPSPVLYCSLSQDGLKLQKSAQC